MIRGGISGCGHIETSLVPEHGVIGHLNQASHGVRRHFNVFLRILNSLRCQRKLAGNFLTTCPVFQKYHTVPKTPALNINIGHRHFFGENKKGDDVYQRKKGDA